jgi:RNA polymerase sigma factor (sigma-70 family)
VDLQRVLKSMGVRAPESRMLGRVRDPADVELEWMYRHHALDVFRYALLLVRSRPDAEDATQATFVRAYRALRRGENVRKPHHWLIKIAHNECRRHLQSAARRSVEIELDAEVTQARDLEDGPTADEIRVALGQLSFNQRAALVMRELDDRTYPEIAGVLGVSVSAVETLLFRARRALREQMEGPVPCAEAEELLSKQLDLELTADEQMRLRAHTRACETCASFERRQRSRRAALRRLGSGITLPSSLGSFLGGGGGGAVVAGAAAVGVKTAAVVVAALAIATSGAGDSPRARADSPLRLERTAAAAPPAASATPAAARPTASAASQARQAQPRPARAAAQAAARPTARSRGAAARATEEPQAPSVSPAAPVSPAPQAAAPATATDPGSSPGPATATRSAAATAASPARPAADPTAPVRKVVGSLPVEVAIPQTPRLPAPPVEVPAVALPSVPSTTVPSVSVPSVEVPPPPSVPQVSTPAVTAPAVPTPTVSTPAIPTPSVPAPPPAPTPSVPPVSVPQEVPTPPAPGAVTTPPVPLPLPAG